MSKNELKYLIIFASPNKHGITADLIKNVEFPSQPEVINIYELMPRPCIDCGFCKEEFSCSQPDLKEEYKLIEQADVIFFAFPVYNMSLPSPLKALIERMQVYYNAHFVLNIDNPMKKHKKIGLIIVSGSDDEYSKNICVSQIKQAFSVMNGSIEFTFWKKNTDILPTDISHYEKLQKMIDKIYE